MRTTDKSNPSHDTYAEEPDDRSPSVDPAIQQLPQRCGFVALIGPPNAGKSTLMNRLVGEKIAIVSPKIQTTRQATLGIVTQQNNQIIFVDTPGIFMNPQKRLERAMVAAAWQRAFEADLIFFLVDSAQKEDPQTVRILEKLQEQKTPCFLLLNKVDRVQKPFLLPLAARFNDRAHFDSTFMLSGLTGEGVSALLPAITPYMPEGVWLYPADQVSDMPLRLLAAELTREQLFLQLHQELPYFLTVVTDSWKEQPDQSIRLDQTILIAQANHRPMILGKNGQRIKSIGIATRRSLSAAIGQPVHLFLHVKEKKDWQESRDYYHETGLNFQA